MFDQSHNFICFGSYATSMFTKCKIWVHFNSKIHLCRCLSARCTAIHYFYSFGFFLPVWRTLHISTLRAIKRVFLCVSSFLSLNFFPSKSHFLILYYNLYLNWAKVVWYFKTSLQKKKCCRIKHISKCKSFTLFWWVYQPHVHEHS